MTTQANFSLRGRNPDVLTCIANLSNDEVFTPPEFANRMLDTLAEAWAANIKGANIWADKTVKFLDPCTKSGVFLREITSRLTQGLGKEIPNLEKRVNHILTQQVFGIGITQITSLLARRSVYCSKHAQGEHSIAKGFASDDGNIWFNRLKHTWVGVTHEALGPVRVMRTCGMMGEIVGKAAWISVRHATSPRGVYEKHLPLLKELMKEPGAMRRATLDGALALPPGVTLPARAFAGINPATLEGIVIDDEAAELTGNWENAGSLTGFVGESYRYSSDAKATARFPFTITNAGLYDVRVAWQPHANRAKVASITVQSAEGEKTVAIDQTQPARGAHGFQSLGQFHFVANEKASVLYRCVGAKGIVHIDAVQIVPAQ